MKNGVNQGAELPGYQCYFYDAPDGTRQGVWIIPELPRIALTENSDKFFTWKQFRSIHGEVSFLYPASWTINTANEESDGTIGVLMGKPADIPPTITVAIVAKNAVGIEDVIAQDMTGSGLSSRENITLNGIAGVQIIHAASESINPDSIGLYFDRNDHYIHVSAQFYKDPFYDYPTAALLGSLKIE